MITSMQNKTVKELLKLKQKKYRKDYYLVETNHLVEEAIKAKQTDLIISTEPVDLGVENLVVSKEIMEKLAFTKTPQPIMARCFIQKDKKLVDGKRYLILDYLQDPGNIGTLIRTALAFSIDQVILSNECVDLYNDKLLRSMQGAHFHLSCLYGDLKEIIPALKEKGVYVKMARGEMVRYMAEHQITDIEDIKQFQGLGYRFQEALSSSEEFIFTRAFPRKK